jgi:hypothetical protein
VSLRFGGAVDAFWNNQRQGLWVPAQGRDDAEGDGAIRFSSQHLMHIDHHTT